MPIIEWLTFALTGAWGIQSGDFMSTGRKLVNQIDLRLEVSMNVSRESREFLLFPISHIECQMRGDGECEL